MRRTLLVLVGVMLTALMGPVGASTARAGGDTAGSGPSVAVAKAPGNSAMDVWSWNITGAGIVESGTGSVDNRGRPGAVDPVIDRLNGGQRPDVIALQELCHAQYTKLAGYLGSIGYRVEWRVNKSQPRCLENYPQADPVHGSEHGTLVAVPAQYAPITPVSLNVSPETPGVAEGLTCVEFVKQRAMIACSAQISGNETEKTLKTHRMYTQVVTPYLDRGYGVILAGDFNAQPANGAMNRMYHPNLGGTGQLFEGDMKGVCSSPCRDGRWTHTNREDGQRRKLDYVFFSSNAYDQRSVSAVLVDERSSYHRFYKFTVPMR